MAIGVVDYASPVGSLPELLCRSFRRAQQYTVYSNEYANGESQRSLISLTSRKVWELSAALTATELSALRTFYTDHDGATVPFSFHDFYEAGITGDYIVRFDGAWNQTVGAGVLCGSVPLRLVEIA